MILFNNFLALTEFKIAKFFFSKNQLKITVGDVLNENESFIVQSKNGKFIILKFKNLKI